MQFGAFFTSPLQRRVVALAWVLPLARLLIELHGGSICFQPLDGAGVLFGMAFLGCEAVPV